MKWFDSPPGYDQFSPYCYCDLIIEPNDLMLQDWLPFAIPATGYTFAITAYSPDGASSYGTFTSSFDWFIATDPSGNPYFSARMNNFPPQLCQQCFILKVTLLKTGATSYTYSQYTNVFCIDNCCTIAKGVTITEGGTSIPVSSSGNLAGGSGSGGITSGGGTGGGGIGGGTGPVLISDSCGLPLLRIEAEFACKDVFSGQYYGDPGTVTSGSYTAGYQYKKVLNIRGTFRRLPRTIEKQISLNSRTQKVQTVRKWELQSSEQFPDWKMDDIEDMFCAPHIYVNGVEYIYPGDTPFRMLYPKEQNSKYALKTIMQEFNKWQIFGCSDDCGSPSERYYGLQRQANAYYSENGALIARTYDELLAYFNSINGSTGTRDITDATIPGGYYKIFKVTGTGAMPAFFYADNVTIGSRIYGKDLDASDPDYTQLFRISSCASPVIGEIAFTSESCQSPVIGTITFSAGETDTGSVHSYRDWFVTDYTNSVVRTDAQCVLTCMIENATIHDDGTGDVFVNGQIIATIDNAFAPSMQQIINHAMNDSIPDGSYLLINPDGTLVWYGTLSTPDHSNATILLIDINYQL